jgi:ParB/RepB/Spo0J family partition protein
VSQRHAHRINIASAVGGAEELGLARTLGQREIALRDLVPDPSNVRKRTTVVGELEQSIKQYGVLEPIVVRPQGAKFAVVIGGRRVAASRALGLASVPAIIKELTDEEALIQSAVENIQRETLDPEDELAIVEKIRAIYPDVGKVASILDRPRSWVEDRITIRSFQADLKDASGLTRGPKPKEIRIPRDMKKVASIVRVAEKVYREQPAKRAALVEELKDKPRETVQRVTKHLREIDEDAIEAAASKPVKEVINKALNVERLPVELEFSTRLSQGLKRAATARNVAVEDIVEIAVEDWLRRNKFL